eukprot:CAMPEP_0182417942 /NCGR_PEP_ID=MMETSP1167-20130531/2406_1 /TAXON_ID=2988 /ORGANISM="Mallomonas Sp, Strain CCMP3275" /LENGTH=259 /DNA_ID=CAMNT_0024591847 /DNA_START=227 /DNA_END=1006 /DNA_ORIENTATION=+
MNIADRFFRVVKSNVNNVLSNLEDPEKVLDQAVGDMQNDLVKIRQSYAEISATQKRLQKQKEQADNLAADWYRRAQLALEKGDEELAREALSRRQTQVKNSETIEGQLNLQDGAIKKLYSAMQELEAKILEAKRQKETFIARARTAKTTVKVNDMLSTVTGSTSSDAFERMKEKVEALEAKAEVAGELAATSSGTTVDLESKFKALEGDSKVEDMLAQMKRQLPSGKPPVAGELPPPRPYGTVVDEEYERLKREMNRKY